MVQETMDLTVFDPIKATLAKLELKDSMLVFDHTTPDGERELRSWVKRVRGFKGDVAKVHKDTKAGALAFGRKVDAIKNELTAGADKIITERMKPLDEIEAKKRADAEAVLQAEEDARLAKEAADKAELERREAEVAKKEAEVREKERVVREKQIAAEAAEKAQKEAKRVAANQAKVAEQEKQAAVEAEKEKARKAEAERLAKIEAEEAEKERLAQIERDRTEDETHRKKIELEISEYFTLLIEDEFIANKVVDELVLGLVPNVTITY